MQTAAAHPSIYCPKCGKPAAMREVGIYHDYEFYFHYTKKGHVWHDVKIERTANPSESDEGETV